MLRPNSTFRRGWGASSRRATTQWKRKWALAFWVLGWCQPLSVCAGPLVNVTLDRTSSSIDYEPQPDGDWREAWPGVRIASDPRSTATFSFEGVAIYYQGWLWSQPTIFTAVVDNATVLIDLTDQANLGNASADAVPTTAVTSLIIGGLTESTHNVVLKKVGDQRVVIVGSFLYSTGNPPSSSTTSFTSTPTPSATSSPSRTKSQNLAVIIPSVIGGIALIALLSLITFLCLRRRRRNNNEERRYSMPPPPEPFHLGAPSEMSMQPSRRISLTGAKHGVRDDETYAASSSASASASAERTVIQGIPADLKQERKYKVWSIE